jgi:hypothetical protein
MAVSCNPGAGQKVERPTTLSEAILIFAMKMTKNVEPKVNLATEIRKALMITVISASLVFPAIANAESGSRIVSFDSKVVISKDRCLNVKETIEIANNDGLFDEGLHRRLWLKPASRERSKPGLFESIHAKVDGRDAQIKTTQENDTLDIGILAEGQGWTRGNHIIELSYAAKNQFAVYGNYEDLNLNVSGDWPVTIENATVELDFPSGMPPRTTISADTGSNSTFQFDCVRTNLSSGVRFETSHPIPPHQRLFISAMFTRGYFVADAAEDGLHATFEKSLLSPPMWIFATLLVFTAVAYLLTPKGMPIHNSAPQWIRLLVVAALPGTAAFALRLIYEQTIMTWREGEQMVGFALSHAYIAFFLPMILSFALAHVALALLLSVTLARWLRRFPTPKWNWLSVVALLVFTGLVYVPYDFWMTTTVRVAGPGSRGTSFLMMAAADGKLPLAKALIAKGVSPNTMAGGSTALDVACSSRNLDVAKFLLQQGAELSRAPSCANLSLPSHGSGRTE